MERKVEKWEEKESSNQIKCAVRPYLCTENSEEKENERKTDYTRSSAH